MKLPICTVLRISLRYRRLAQIDEGYSIPLTPLEHLARTVYADDPADCFQPKAEGMRPMEVIARMQKAAAIMQFKLEGQVIERNPQWKLEHRRLLHRLDLEKGTIVVDGVTYALRDRHFPTIDVRNPYTLSPEEQACMERLRHSFLNSQKLSEHMRFMVANGSMYLDRDDHLIFHGCVPCDERGVFLPLGNRMGTEVAGKAMFDAIEHAIIIRPMIAARLQISIFCGTCGPARGRRCLARIASRPSSRDFIADVSVRIEETKRIPYLALIHEEEFCDRVLHEFHACPARGLIVNGHVPVKIEKGESPLKRSGKAITIDGAFSEAYGDHGYTLVMEAGQTLLARHHHFESVEAAVKDGVDIIPTVALIRECAPARKIADTERGRGNSGRG